MRRPLHFWMPEPDQFPSGGNVYNANIEKALVELGHPVTQAADWVEHRPQDGLLIVDTLMLGQPALATAPDEVPILRLRGFLPDLSKLRVRRVPNRF